MRSRARVVCNAFQYRGRQASKPQMGMMMGHMVSCNVFNHLKRLMLNFSPCRKSLLEYRWQSTVQMRIQPVRPCTTRCIYSTNHRASSDGALIDWILFKVGSSCSNYNSTALITLYKRSTKWRQRTAAKNCKLQRNKCNSVQSIPLAHLLPFPRTFTTDRPLQSTYPVTCCTLYLFLKSAPRQVEWHLLSCVGLCVRLTKKRQRLHCKRKRKLGIRSTIGHQGGVLFVGVCFI